MITIYYAGRMGISLGLISQVFGFDSRSRIQFNIMSENNATPTIDNKEITPLPKPGKADYDQQGQT